MTTSTLYRTLQRTRNLWSERDEGKERKEEAATSYEILKSLDSSNFDSIHLALAYYAFALCDPASCISYIEKVPHLLQYQEHVPGSSSVQSSTLLAPSSYAISTTSVAGSLASSASLLDVSIPEVRDGRGWALAETVQSLCPQGMSTELLYPSEPLRAISIYGQALPLLAALRNELRVSAKPLPSTSSTSNAVFSQLRELWRWVERLMWRAVVLNAKVADAFNSPVSDSGTSTPTLASSQTDPSKNTLWAWLDLYGALGTTWPPLFRAKHRSTVYNIHLRAFIIRLGGAAPKRSSAVPNGSSFSTPTLSAGSQTAASDPLDRETALTLALSTVNAYKAVLGASTRFPRAGEKNIKVEEFVELCVVLWEAGWVYGDDSKGKKQREEGLGTRWVIDVLHWAQSLTFNSSMILRHLTRLLYLSCPPALSYKKADTNNAHHTPTGADLAKRTLRLYIQVVSKAFEASQEGVGEDMDLDIRWIETLVFGARMLAANAARNYQEHGGGIYDGSLVADVQEAVDILSKARERLDKSDFKLTAEVLLAEGITYSVMGIIAQDPLTRPNCLHKAHAFLVQSIQTHPTPTAYYHLALSFSRRLQPVPTSQGITRHTAPDSTPNIHAHTHTYSLTSALECSGLAVEGCSTDVRFWHLLGLLLTAKEDWNGAKEVLQRGAELDQVDEDGTEDLEASPSEASNTGPAGPALGSLQATDFSNPNPITVDIRLNGFAASLADDISETATPTAEPAIPPLINGGPAAHRTITVLETRASTLPPASDLFSYLRPPPSSSPVTTHPHQLTFDEYPSSPSQIFERHLQLRMTQVALMEVMDGPEGAEEGWLDVFSWVADQNAAQSEGTKYAPSTHAAGTDDGHGRTETVLGAPSVHTHVTGEKKSTYDVLNQRHSVVDVSQTQEDGQSLIVPIGITISPATPINGPDGGQSKVSLAEVSDEKAALQESDRKGNKIQRIVSKIGNSGYDDEKTRDSGDRGRSSDGKRSLETKTKSKRSSSVQDRHEMASINDGSLYPRSKRSTSGDRTNGDHSASKKVQQMLHKSRAGITAVSRKIGGKGHLRRANSTPDFHAMLQPTSYQASSIHSRKRISSIIHDSHDPYTRSTTPLHGASSPTPPYSPYHRGRDFTGASNTTAPSSPHAGTIRTNGTSAEKPGQTRTNRLLSNLWLMSAATFRRLGKTEQTRGAIQEAEVKNESNPNVWVQLGLYYVSLHWYQHAVDTLLKARFIAPEDVASAVHLSRLYLDPKVTSKLHFSTSTISNIVPTTTSAFAHASSPKQQPVAPTLASATSSPSVQTASQNPLNSAVSDLQPAVDLAAGMLNYCAQTRGWDVPEVWYLGLCLW
ncbi:hypothetical protein D9619_008793 [Psilocybe cf. subviscida]|uniref:Uncharacterized protein n=1 Tax=Psilocybe cf. subviscida TaxID=2480587 RepID=A0A8H5BA35_9AGAR|nr:hypothetical protein D9619_008793 [Psilocybe cf. subviscida]